MSKTLLYGATRIDGLTAVSGLDSYRWKNRVLVIFEDMDNAKASRQENLLLSDKAGLAERDMVILKCAADGVSPLFGSAPVLDPVLDRDGLGEELEAPEAGVFAAILVGKDGSVKLRAIEPVSCNELFAIIDGMPMRAAEATRQQDL